MPRKGKKTVRLASTYRGARRNAARAYATSHKVPYADAWMRFSHINWIEGKRNGR
jgi:hypothetical protein